MSDGNGIGAHEDFVRRHLCWGWCALLIFLLLGLALEGMHGFKVGWYLDVSSEPRRLTWTLAHSHGALLGLVNVAFALTLRALPEAASGSWVKRASLCLRGATVLLPGGFFLGGIVIYGGDPGILVVLAAVGGVLLAAAVALTARAVLGARR